MLNLYAIAIITITAYLVILTAYMFRRLARPERIAEETPRIAREAEKASRKMSRKKAEVIGLRYRKLRSRLFRISMISSTIPLAIMAFVLLYVFAVYGELGLVAPSSCSLPPPVELQYADRGKAPPCLIYTIWIVFLTYIAIMPLYNRISGIDLLKEAGKK